MQNELMNQNDKANESNLTPEATSQANRRGAHGDQHSASSSESLVDSEMSVGHGAVTGEKGTVENKEANPIMMGENPDRERLSGNRSN
jgi:hypothetical protein